MNPYEYAMEMEKEGEAFYRDLATQTDNTGLKRIFTMLADNEVKHYQAFKSMNEKGAELTETPIIEDVKAIFQEMKVANETDGIDQGQSKLYEEALLVENKNEAFYRAKAEESTDPAHKEIFIKIADEEKNHVVLLTNLVEMVQRPVTWIENAEYYQMEEY